MSKELFSKFTFGFLMAQLFPGAVAVSAVALAIEAVNSETATGDLMAVLCGVYDNAFGSASRLAIYLFLAVGTGMLIHGIHWSVLAWLENRQSGEYETPIVDSFWHGKLVVVQLLLGPVKMILELVWLLFAGGLGPLRMTENVPRVPPSRMPNFLFLQEFYLYFAQFYAHTAWALLFCIPCLIVVFTCVGWTWMNSLYVGLAYLATSVFFLLGRVQLASLFEAENALADYTDDGENKPRAVQNGKEANR